MFDQSILYKRLFSAVLLTACILVPTSGCSDDGADLVIYGDTFKLYEGDEFDFEGYLEELKSGTDSDTDGKPETADTAAYYEDSKTADAYGEDTVYWIKTGAVWHTKEDCSAISSSADIISGTTELAIESGKTRACKRCGG